MTSFNLMCRRAHQYWPVIISLLFVMLLPLLLYSQSAGNEEASDEVLYNESRPVIWYNQSWVWAIAAALLILVVAFLSRKGGDNDGVPQEKGEADQ